MEQDVSQSCQPAKSKRYVIIGVHTGDLFKREREEGRDLVLNME